MTKMKEIAPWALTDEEIRKRPPTIYEEIIEALSEREMELEAALSAGFPVARRLEALRSLLQRFRDIAAFAAAAQSLDHGQRLACCYDYDDWSN